MVKKSQSLVKFLNDQNDPLLLMSYFADSRINGSYCPDWVLDRLAEIISPMLADIESKDLSGKRKDSLGNILAEHLDPKNRIDSKGRPAREPQNLRGKVPGFFDIPSARKHSIRADYDKLVNKGVKAGEAKEILSNEYCLGVSTIQAELDKTNK